MGKQTLTWLCSSEIKALCTSHWSLIETIKRSRPSVHSTSSPVRKASMSLSGPYFTDKMNSRQKQEGYYPCVGVSISPTSLPHLLGLSEGCDEDKVFSHKARDPEIRSPRKHADYPVPPCSASRLGRPTSPPSHSISGWAGKCHLVGFTAASPTPGNYGSLSLTSATAITRSSEPPARLKAARHFPGSLIWRRKNRKLFCPQPTELPTKKVPLKPGHPLLAASDSITQREGQIQNNTSRSDPGHRGHLKVENLGVPKISFGDPESLRFCFWRV